MSPIKIKYFKSHLIISLLIVLTISIICQFLWFPSPFLFIDGTWIALLILATVDIILGPSLTFLLINSVKSKKAILVDIFVITILQLSALTYGLLQIEKERVVALVHSNGAFSLVPKKELNNNDYAYLHKLPQYQGIYYAMVLDSDLVEHSKGNTKPLLYSPASYKKLNKNITSHTQYPYEKLPIDIQKMYSSDYIFKVLAGKKENAILVFTNNMVLIDIILLPPPEKMPSQN
ncbi:hypothetical protein ACOYR1_14870 [Thalassotalea piscium]